MPGLLSQVLDNLSQTETTIRSVQVFPSSTQQIQQDMLAGLDQLRDECGALRNQVTAYTTPALAQLNDITALLNAAQPSTDGLIGELRRVQAGAQELDAQAESVLTVAKTTLDKQNAFQQQLNDENQTALSNYSDLQARVSELQAEIDDDEAQSSGSSDWEKLFLPGGMDEVVSDLAGAIVGLKSDLDEAQNELQEVQTELTYQQTIIQGTTDLMDHTSKVVDILSGIRNMITMVTADLDNLFATHPDLDKTAVLRLFAAQATSEVQSLLSDGS